jgi:tRNA-splicing ligase RtcB
MSRTQAAGKQGTIAECSDRDCHYSKTWKQYKAETSGLRPDQITFCPDHPRNRALKVRKRIREGEINWTATLDDLASKHIVLRGGAADEAPGAYKRLDDVLAYHADTIEILHRLKPIGVAMAGADVYDPYKD